MENTSTFTANIISDEDRAEWLDNNFQVGNDFGMRFENMLYNIMSETEGYNGGYFDFVEYSNGAKCFRLTDNKTYHCVHPMGIWEGELSAEAFSLAASLVAINRMCWALYEKGDKERSEYFGELYYNLMGVAGEHPEGSKIFAFID